MESKARVIEVCCGPDCSQGGAALLEIEELVAEGTVGISISRGGCRDLCSVGPNVYHDGYHFSKVKSPEDCRDLLQARGTQLEWDTVGESSSRVGKMLMKKSIRLRWDLLKAVARCKDLSMAKRRMEEWKESMDQIYRTELSAVRMMDNKEERSERAKRRNNRLKQTLERKLHPEADGSE